MTSTRLYPLHIALTVCFLAGCGGGADSVGSSASDEEHLVGNVAVRGSLTREPLVQTGSRTTVTALQGQFSQVRVRYTNANLENAMIVWSSDGQTMYSMDGDGSRRSSFMQVHMVEAADFNLNASKLFFVEKSVSVRNMLNAVNSSVRSDQYYYDVAVSPNGTKLALTRSISGTSYDLMICDVSGANPVVLPPLNARAVEWLSDTRLAYLADTHVRLINVDGTGDTAASIGSSEIVDDIAISPDGNSLAVSGLRDGVKEVATHIVRGGSLIGSRVFPFNNRVAKLHWTPDSQQLLALDTGATCFSSGDLRRSISLPDLLARPAHSWPWLSLLSFKSERWSAPVARSACLAEELSLRSKGRSSAQSCHFLLKLPRRFRS
jgi:WD40 repeat protein